VLEPFYFEVKVGALLAFLHQFLKTAFRQTICVMDKIYVSELSDCLAVRSSGGFGGHYVTEVGSSGGLVRMLLAVATLITALETYQSAPSDKSGSVIPP
jgi:hypothetical protein